MSIIRDAIEPYIEWIKLVAAILLLAAVGYAVCCAYGWAYDNGAASVQAKFDKHLAQDAIASQKDSEAARAKEHELAVASAKAAEAYEQGKRDAEAAGKRVADGLRAGALKLRKQWQGCESRLSDPAADPRELEAENGLRQSGTGRIIGTVTACQAQRDGLLNLLEAERN